MVRRRIFGATRLSLIRGADAVDTLVLDDVPVADAVDWLDKRLEQAGLNPAAAIQSPYDLPAEVGDITVFRPGPEMGALEALAAWFGLADVVLGRFATEQSELTPGPVRCWPHHFDIATYVGLEDGDYETARGIGVGLSPGDEAYDQPYFYVNPWPHLDPAGLPQAPRPGH